MHFPTDFIHNPSTTIQASIAMRQLTKGAVDVRAKGSDPFVNWTKEQHEDAYSYMHRIANSWEKSNFTDQNLIYGKIDEKNWFNWQIVPYTKCTSFFQRIVQQIQVLCKITFGASLVSEDKRTTQIKKYAELEQYKDTDLPDASKRREGDDAFCKKKATLCKNQRVVEGDLINIFYDYAPIGFGGEKLHFLVVPKGCAKVFTDLTKEEYVEAMQLTQKLIITLKKTRDLTNVYLFSKSGKDAGQTQKHWHMHVIATTSPLQNILGKLTVLRKILFGALPFLGSSPLKASDLEIAVSKYKSEFEGLKNVLLPGENVSPPEEIE